MKYRYLVVAIITPIVLVLDQVTKWAVVKYLPLGHEIPVIPGFFDIVHAQNSGAAFGMFAGADAGFRVPFFYAVAAIAVVVIGLMLWRMRDDERLLPITFALIMGGIAGNIIDRVRFGVVIDFLSVHWKDVTITPSLFGRTYALPLYWPAFNVADSAITIAMVLLVISAFRKPVDSIR